jgi:hypothetical protein
MAVKTKTSYSTATKDKIDKVKTALLEIVQNTGISADERTRAAIELRNWLELFS